MEDARPRAARADQGRNAVMGFLNAIGEAAKATAGAVGKAASDPGKAFEDAVEAAQGVADDVGAAVGRMSPSDLGHMGLDVVGMIPVVGEAADLANAGWYAAEGDMVNAGLSAAAAVPGAGNVATAAKWGKRALDAADAVGDVSKVAKAAEKTADGAKGAEKVADGAKATKQVDGVPPTTPTGRTFEGTLRGEKVAMPDVPVETMKYTKRTDEAREGLRKEFNSTERKEFVKGLAADDAGIKKLKDAGFTEKDIAKIKDGKIPQGWQVHHKAPLDDGGTNKPGNLVLIENEPWHKAITNEQNALTKGMEPGDSRTLDWPMVPGTVYPPKPPEVG
jgi:hypothetical protein